MSFPSFSPDGGVDPTDQAKLDEITVTVPANLDSMQADIAALETGFNRRRSCINVVDNTAVPPTELNGDRYIIDDTGVSNAAWDGAAQNSIVQFNGTSGLWEEQVPNVGWVAFLTSTYRDALFTNDGGNQWEIRPTAISIHNDLSGLQGGLAGERNHLSNAQISALHAAVTLNPDAKTQAALILSGQQIQIKDDVYDYANATGVTQGTGGTLIHTLTGTTDDFNPTDFLTYNYFIFDMSSDQDFTGWEAPPSGVERIIRGINKSDKKIKFKDNDSGSVAANRLSLKEYGNRDCKKGECFAFRYVESELRWWPENRIG